ncbi:FAD-dependent monooxygenase [Candidatus Blochmanniella pennsylvanica]|uniref:FAD-dependent monooxygenase n=1 Tax=Candidatus Blochmanniella pennsylvanica TaxID=101534 RepID=UPI001FF56FAD|nr:FAD-dependent monooxygenase [Candidatus Blochmannia pennsylvanicus]UOY04180.1 FAD-dependent monooxygenase [Candidatus Blochmannia pennsylvanicus]
MNKLFCDVLIFGAGIIGASLALRLSKSGIKVIIVDHTHPVPMKKKPHIRVAAINYASIEFLKQINIWKKIPSNFCTPYHRLEVWECPSSKVIFHSMSAGVSMMGCIIENNRLQLALWEDFVNFKTITLYCPSILVSTHYDGFCWRCILDNGVVVVSRLLIGADGIYSQVRKILGIGVIGWKYRQFCMLLTIKTDKCKNGTIWQIFTPWGPIGFLPLYNHWGSLMWYNTPERIQELQQLPVAMLEKKIENNFQKQLGNVKLHNMTVVPLIRQCAYNYITSGGALVGDAAHSLHPLAGQGINLGLRDVMSLSRLLINSRVFDEYSSISEVLISYQKSRKYDSFLMQSCIDWLYVIFHNNYLPLKIARNVAFMTVERSLYLKRKVLKYALGI